MADFVLDATTNSGTVNFPKFDRQSIPPGTDPTKVISGSEWSALCQAVVDIRRNVLSGSLFGFNVRYANAGSIPNIPGHDKVAGDFLWVDSNGELTLHRKNNTDHKAITRNSLNRTGLNVLNPSGTVHVFNDGTDPRVVILQQVNTPGVQNYVEFLREVTGHRAFVGQFQNATDGFNAANAFFVAVNDGTTTRYIMNAAPAGDRLLLGHSSNAALRIGVATTGPTKKVDIAGDLRVQQSSSFDSDVYVSGTLFSKQSRLTGRAEVTGSWSVSGSADLVGPLSASSVTVGGHRLQPMNLAMNGNFRLWQRNSGAFSLSTAAPARTFITDRWYYWTYKFGSSDTTFTWSRASASLPGTQYALRIKNGTTSAGTTDNYGLAVQEIDRDFVKSVIGKKVTLTAKIRVGSSFINNGATVAFYIMQNSGSETENLTNYTGAGTLFSANLTASLDGIGSSFVTISRTSANAVASGVNGMSIFIAQGISGSGHAGDANDWVEFTDVMLTAGESQPDYFEWTGRTLQGEIANCLRYYEKTYDLESSTGSNEREGRHLTAAHPVNTLVGSEFRLGMHPRFQVRKRVIPTIRFWAEDGAPGPTGLAGSWSFATAGQIPVAAGFPSQNGFGVINNSTASFTPPTELVFGHWTADAEI